MTTYAFRLSKTLIRANWAEDTMECWKLSDDFVLWCIENFQSQHVFSFVGNPNADTEYVWASYYWLLLDNEPDATLLQLTYPDEVIRIELPPEQ